MSSVNAQQGSAASMAVNARPAESRDVSKARAAAYSHDNVFARIHARGEDPGAGIGGDGQAEADLEDLEIYMTAYQPPAGKGDGTQVDSRVQ
ncbi:hypothetical protein NCS57_00116200 [Fusarium keratoplasticum]|uniref:Uncharacterized protein n=1 Tax=Fusarium keratoplasticum TaxID=1328300 RepID=A0ACC0RGB3_9HYPO|nr:hypothetical protein NCS57_00116200 [Fusarium keratoplasticum]KAI8684500.1 hypothetical protein NCS57_00116200 [Fusarium keratoplasticum]KAI8688612.1 hypothetical protein NCS55_00115200 [Fusarium keratoplasticum]